jgi:hypothetical protein
MITVRFPTGVSVTYNDGDRDQPHRTPATSSCAAATLDQKLWLIAHGPGRHRTASSSTPRPASSRTPSKAQTVDAAIRMLTRDGIRPSGAAPAWLVVKKLKSCCSRTSTPKPTNGGTDEIEMPALR